MRCVRSSWLKQSWLKREAARASDRQRIAISAQLETNQ